MLRKQVDVLLGLFVVAGLAWMIWEAGKWDNRARLFPVAIAVPTMGFALLQIGFSTKNLLASRAGVKAVPEPPTAPVVEPAVSVHVDPALRPPSSIDTESAIAAAMEAAFGAGSEYAEEEHALDPVVERQRTLAMIGWVVAMALGIATIGLELGSAILTLVFLRFAAKERWGISLWIAGFTYLFFFIVFDRALNIPLPPGWINDTLGIKSVDSYVMDPIADFIGDRYADLSNLVGNLSQP
ncbi:MAG: hypothetical protein WCO31_08120, partial [Actinomycetes bacterium]